MEKILIPAQPDAPVACDMSGAFDTQPERMAEYGRLFEHALVARERLQDDPGSGGQPRPSGLRFTFAAKPGVEAWLADLVRREAACCPFLSYQVDMAGDQIVWTITNEASDAAQAILDDFFATTAHVNS